MPYPEGQLISASETTLHAAAVFPPALNTLAYFVRGQYPLLQSISSMVFIIIESGNITILANGITT